MRIVYLLSWADELWGGVKSVLEGANLLVDRGHQVTVVTQSGPPDWMDLRCELLTVPRLNSEAVPEADIVVGTFWPTVPTAVRCGRGVPVHLCQGYEGDNPESAPHREQIEAIYALAETHKVTISPHLTNLLRDRFGVEAHEVPYMINTDTLFAEAERAPSRPVRIGIVGPYDVPGKDIPGALAACELAHRAGLELQVVRVSTGGPCAGEEPQPFPVEWHTNVPPAQMGQIYRSLDLLVGSCRHRGEGFYLPAVEAMACGVPCVLTDIPCHRGYGEGQYALFVPPEDPAALAEAIVVGSSHQVARSALREAGLAVAARYRPEAHVDALEAFFASLCASPPATATANAPAAVLPAKAPDLSHLNRAMIDALRSVSKAYEDASRPGEALALREAAAKLERGPAPVP
ncbi:MAG: glycosyltransferase family 4 protein [Planctomycetota bacterium]